MQPLFIPAAEWSVVTVLYAAVILFMTGHILRAEWREGRSRRATAADASVPVEVMDERRGRHRHHSGSAAAGGQRV
jgi:hypothetical protein